jgi:hypothetical protein
VSGARLLADLPFDRYQSLPGLNWSVLKHAITSARHYRLAVDGESAPSDADFSGHHAMHAAVLEPETYADRYRVWSGSARRGKAFDEACAADPHVTWLTPSADETARAVAAAVAVHPVAGPLLQAPVGGRAWSEATIVWGEGGRVYKGRLDRLVWGRDRRVIVDLKAVQSLQPRKMAATVARYHYHGQAAHYAAGLRALEAAQGLAPAPIDAYLVCYETRPIVDVGVYYLGSHELDGAIWTGARLRDEAIARIAAAETAGVWPGQAPETVALELPAWAYGDDDDDYTEAYRD